MVPGSRCTGHDVLQQTSVEIPQVVSSAVPLVLEDASKYILLVLFCFMFHPVIVIQKLCSTPVRFVSVGTRL